MTEQQQFDVIVIGGGPGGYVAAIRAAQLGLNTLCIDDRQNNGRPAPGGACLNVGCIPSKALLDSTKHYHHIQHQYQSHGIQADNVRMDVATMLERKNKVVKQLNGGVMQLFKANKVTYINGRGKLLNGRQVQITPIDGGEPQVHQGKNIILASGSLPIQIPNVAVDNEFIVDNEGALQLQQAPQRLGVIGAGVIGLELGSVWNRLGSEVILFEALPDFLAACDTDISKQAAREFKKQGLDVRLNTKVKQARINNEQVDVLVEGANGEEQLQFDRLLVAVGRRAASHDLLAADSGVQIDERGRVVVDDHCHTGVDGVWAIGDLVRGPMLAHKASEEGIAVVEVIAGQAGHINLDTIPWVIYTDPEIAWVGKTEQQLKNEGVDYKSGSFPFAATGRGLAMGDAVGMVKILADAESDQVLGVHIMGANASELIAECVVTMEFAGSAEDLARIVHAHPTLSEAVHEAALHVDKRAIHRAN